MFYIYILQLNNGMLYKGFSRDLKLRIIQHTTGKVRTTNKRNPRLIHYECYLEKSDALRREKFLKTTEGIRLLTQQLRDVIKKHALVV